MKNLVNKSYLGTVGYVSSDSYLAELEQYLMFNKQVFDQFKGIIVASNYAYKDLINRNHELWNKYFDNVVFIDLDINRGHTFGTIDSDKAIFNYCKENNIEWLFKSSNDMLYYPEFLDNQIDVEADFYYMNGIGYGGMEKYNYNIEEIIANDFYPQTNSYFINVSKTKNFVDEQYVDRAYEYILTLDNYNGKIWEYIPNFSCEDFLKQCVIENELKRHHLIDDATYRRLLSFIIGYQVHDCSHKQLLINGLCHYQNAGQQMYKI